MTRQALPQPIQAYPRISQWLSFAEVGVVQLRSGRVELGQGIASALVQIAAEELDVRPEQINLVAGDTLQCPDEGFTSGSRSIEAGGMAVRHAASAARHLLLREAAKLLQARPEQLSVAEGTVYRDDQPTDLTYWKLAAEANLDSPVESFAAPKPAAARKLVGRKLPRHDLPAKIAGAAFIHDIELPGMVHGRVLHPPSLHRRLLEIDEAALAALPGVLKVVRDGSFLGLIAETEIQALRALARAEALARWSEGRATSGDPVAEVRDTAAEAQTVYESGDPAQVKGRPIETVVTRPFISHASIGPACAIAQWSEEGLRVYSHCQGAFPLRGALATVLGLPEERIRVIHAAGAGCYGHNGADDAALDAALLARELPGRPVRVLWTRADELGTAPAGPAMAVRIKAVIGADKRISGWSTQICSQPHGVRPGRSGNPNLYSAALLAKPFPFGRAGDVPFANGGGADRNAVPDYDIPAVRVAKRIIHDLPYRASSLRGLGAYINVYAVETLMDDIAHEIGVDPVRLRLDHLKDARARAVIERAAEAAGWPGDADETSALGLGYARYKQRAAYCAVAVRVEVAEEVRVTHAWASVDAGALVNPDGAANQIEGGIIQSTSWTLKEGLQFEGDAVVSRDFESYPILRFSEVPQLAVDFVPQTDAPELGVGEASVGPTAAAISNALRRALGVRIRNLPITRDAIVAALT